MAQDLPIAKPEDFALGDVCTFGDDVTEFVVVETAPCVRFVPKDSGEARRVLARVNLRNSLNQRITDSFSRKKGIPR